MTLVLSPIETDPMLTSKGVFIGTNSGGMTTTSWHLVSGVLKGPVAGGRSDPHVGQTCRLLHPYVLSKHGVTGDDCKDPTCRDSPRQQAASLLSKSVGDGQPRGHTSSAHLHWLTAKNRLYSEDNPPSNQRNTDNHPKPRQSVFHA